MLSREEAQVTNIYTEDPNKLDIIVNLNSIKLLTISDQFDLYPGEEVDLEQFVKIMENVLAESQLSSREDFK